MEQAERIARDEHGSRKLAVISGVGTRDYYRRLGYELEGPYMVKMLVDEEDEQDDAAAYDAYASDTDGGLYF